MKSPRVAKRDPPAKPQLRHGTLKLEIVGAIAMGVGGFQTIGATGACSGGSKWSKLCKGANGAPSDKRLRSVWLRVHLGKEFMRGQSAIVAAVVAALLPLGAACADAAGCAAADPLLAGHYYLQGVMEVGSELLLKADGRFEYMLAYGALDELASGCWTRNGGAVTLHAEKFEVSMEDPRKFTQLQLTVAPGGKLIRRFNSEHVGAYTRN